MWKISSWTWRCVVHKGRQSGDSNASLCRPLSQLPSSSGAPQQCSSALETICVQLIILPQEIMRVYREPRGETLAFERSTLCLHFQTPGEILIQETMSLCKRKKKKGYLCSCSYEQVSELTRSSASCECCSVFVFGFFFQPVHDCGSRGHTIWLHCRGKIAECISCRWERRYAS